MIGRRCAVASGALVWLALPCAPAALPAQERILGAHAVAAAMSFERVTFSGAGLAQPGFAGAAGARITDVQQLTMPLSAATPLGRGWRADVTSLYASGRVTYTEGGVVRTSALAGVSDTRVRATGPLLRDGVVVTLGANLPTGRASLTPEEFSALRVLAAPALGLGSAAVGSGPSGTVGVVVTRPAGAWSLAAGASYEYRGQYQPIAAISAGAPSADFKPGAVARASLAADRTIGEQRLSVAAAVDLFAEDRLQASAGPGTTEAPTPAAVATVRLGPVFSADAQLQLATPVFRDVLVHATLRHRMPYSRDGIAVASSHGSYLESGVRGVRTLSRRIDGIVALDARWHSGLGVDQGLPTHGVTSGGVTLAAQARRGLLTVQPYLRGQAGVLRPTGSARAIGRQGFGASSAGLIVVSRF